MKKYKEGIGYHSRKCSDLESRMGTVTADHPQSQAITSSSLTTTKLSPPRSSGSNTSSGNNNNNNNSSISSSSIQTPAISTTSSSYYHHHHPHHRSTSGTSVYCTSPLYIRVLLPFATLIVILQFATLRLHDSQTSINCFGVGPASELDPYLYPPHRRTDAWHIGSHHHYHNNHHHHTPSYELNRQDSTHIARSNGYQIEDEPPDQQMDQSVMKTSLGLHPFPTAVTSSSSTSRRRSAIQRRALYQMLHAEWKLLEMTSNSTRRSSSSSFHGHFLTSVIPRQELRRQGLVESGAQEDDDDHLYDNDPQLHHQDPLPLLQPRLNPDDLRRTEVVMTTHVSSSRWDNLLLSLQRWNGPASVAVWVKSEQEVDTFCDFIYDYQGAIQNATFHIFMENIDDPCADTRYPNNILRNLAMENLGGEAEYFLMLDVDHMPCLDCYSKIQAFVDHYGDEEIRNEKRVMIVPAFEMFPEEDDGTNFTNPNRLPKSRHELLTMYYEKKIDRFHSSYEQGHRLTNYTQWESMPPVMTTSRRNQNMRGAAADNDESDSTMRDLQEEAKRWWYPVTYERGAEPYVVAHRRGIPRCWEKFRGFGFNKVSWLEELHYAGYQFGTLRDVFLVHLNHPQNVTAQQASLEENHAIYRSEFVPYLKRFYSSRQGPRKHKHSSSRIFLLVLSFAPLLVVGVKAWWQKKHLPNSSKI